MNQLGAVPKAMSFHGPIHSLASIAPDFSAPAISPAGRLGSPTTNQELR